MKLDAHDFEPSHQNEDVPQLSEEKLGKETVRESENVVLFDAKEKTLDSSQIEVRDQDGFWQVSERGSYNSVNSNTAGTYTEEVNDYEALKFNSYEDFRQIMERMNLFPDESRTELEVPELVICYKENSYLGIKDICVDENMPSCEKVLFETDVQKGDLRSLLLLEKDTNDEDPNSETPDNQVDKQDSMPTEIQWHEVAEDVSVSQTLSKDQESATEILLQEPPSEDTRHEDTQTSSKEAGMETIPSSPAPPPAEQAKANISRAEEPDSNSLIGLEGEASSSPSEDSSRPVKIGSPGNGSQEKQVAKRSLPKVSDTSAGSFRDSLGEMSFSVADPISGLITYSGPIAYSGSLSLRSESSTTSTRSFAFPILQSEWHSSPVRMAKADRRRFWKRRILCCRF